MAEILSKGKIFCSSTYDHRGSNLFFASPKARSYFPFSSSSSSSSSSKSGLFGKALAIETHDQKVPISKRHTVPVEMTLTISKAMRWWAKGVHPNMKEISSAQDLVDSLTSSSDKLVIVDFFSPGCGGCKSLHPKICQFAENNPNVVFLQVNYEEHKSMCYTLNVHVLPFFRFYRGAHGRLCSFSCTNATIKKFKDAMAKHSTERCSLGPAKGLEEAELMALAANKDLNFCYSMEEEIVTPVPEIMNPIHSISGLPFSLAQESEEALAAAGR